MFRFTKITFVLWDSDEYLSRENPPCIKGIVDNREVRTTEAVIQKKRVFAGLKGHRHTSDFSRKYTPLFNKMYMDELLVPKGEDVVGEGEQVGAKDDLHVEIGEYGKDVPVNILVNAEEHAN
ncbi:hypothetical protein L1987_02053 [Smallanthus sonchifolius]|uniref:Uncharacterized protein n=1 Tax=Smallanthus sonchifolius TaxID=185202 RepID=A0ACB9K6T2_9ASTR|nr:hypothetical protein L1987_02053 [Smallanthus sonchifolius]